MARAAGSIPSRTIDPIKVNYCILNKARFIRLVNAINDILDQVYKKKLSIAIEIPGFDEPFASAEDVDKELSHTDWKKLKGIEVNFFEEDEYSPTAKISLGKPSWDDAIGAKIDVLKGSTPDKLSARGLIEQLIPDFTRRVLISDKIVGLVSTVLTYIVLIAVIVPRYPNHNDPTILFLLLLVIFWFSYSLYWVVPIIQRKYILPHLELVGENEKTKWDTVWKLLGVIVVIASLIVGIMAL